MIIQKVTQSQDLQACYAIRVKVFVEGKNISLEEDFDGLDAQCEHYLLTIDGKPIGTSRIRYVDDKAKIERMAILDTHQRRGLGKQLMRTMIEAIVANGQCSAIILAAQIHAISFYETLGFLVCSDEFMDAGIPHKDMVLHN